MNEIEEDPPPFWLQSTTALRHAHSHQHHRNRRRQASSLFLNTGVLVVFLLVAAIVFLVIVIPSVLSLARQVFNPSSVKSSWNSLNIVLVLFAVVCGFLGKRDDDSTTPVNTPVRREVEEREYQRFDGGGGKLRRRLTMTRNSSSYPDLREEESMWMMRERESIDQWRFYDDTNLYNNQQFSNNNQRFERRISYRSRSQPLPMVDEDRNVDDVVGTAGGVGGGDGGSGDAKTIEVDTCVDRSPEVSPPPPSPPPVVASEAVTVDDEYKGVVEEDESDKSVEIETPVSSREPKVVLPEPPSNPPQPPSPSPPPSPAESILPPPSPTTYLWPPPSPNSYFWPPPSPSPPPPPPPPPPLPRRNAHSSAVSSKQQIKEIYETIGHYPSKSRVQLPPPSPPPPPPPPPPAKKSSIRHSDEKKEKSEKKKGGVTKEFLVSFYHQTKRKRKQKRRSYENLDEFIEVPPKTSIHRSKSTPEFPPSSPPRAPSQQPPPPPPPPPPPSVFHNLFTSRKSKSKKKVHSVPPPPPPPPRQPATSSAPKPTKTKKKDASAPAKTVSFSIDANGNQSPLINPIPPPPPPPPFTTKPPWKVVMQGDYVKLESYNNSPRSGYSASEDDEVSPSSSSAQTASAVSCPSPDVNMKADDFIAKFRAKLKLEKMDSIKQKQETGPSPLGTNSGLSSA